MARELYYRAPPLSAAERAVQQRIKKAIKVDPKRPWDAVMRETAEEDARESSAGGRR